MVKLLHLYSKRYFLLKLNYPKKLLSFLIYMSKLSNCQFDLIISMDFFNSNLGFTVILDYWKCFILIILFF
jgi:hypothetical protein